MERPRNPVCRKEPGEWWAVAKDVAIALAYRDAHNMVRMLDDDDKDTHIVSTPSGNQEMLIISEYGIYDAIFNSRKPEAKDFKRWVFSVLKILRQKSGLEGFQVFRMMDKDHQKGMMDFLNGNLPDAKRTDFIKSNTIANKAVSTLHGYAKMIKKDEMSPQMLQDRQPILEDTVQLIVLKDKFGIDISVSEFVYKKYGMQA